MGHNLRLALRQLRKTPWFTLTVVLTLALGIGAATAVFSVVEGVLLRPLPFMEPDRLVVLGDHLGNGPGISVTAREIRTYSRATSAFSSMGGYTGAQYELSGNAQPEEVYAARLTASMFPTLGVEPALGRVFTQQEDDANEPVAVISYSLWTNRYHRDPHVLGTSIDLDRRTYSVIGVMPRDFEFPVAAGRLDLAQVWVPLSLTPEELSESNAGFWGYRLIARLKHGVSQQQGAEDANRVAAQIMRDFPPSMSKIRIRGDARLLREFTLGEVRPVLRTLFLAVAFVLLIACVNTSGLLLVRAIRQRREYALRVVLGARSREIISGAILEGILLSAAGGLFGLAFAAVAVRTALRLLPESLPRIDSISMDAGVGAFALLIALATGAACSLAPAFAALRTNLNECLKEGARMGTGAATHVWLRSALVVCEVAIALVLLTVCGAFLRSFQNMRAVDPGFRPERVLTAAYQLPLAHYPTQSSVTIFHRNLVDRLSSRPGVVSVGITNSLPASDLVGRSAYTVEGQPVESWTLNFADFAITYGDYFRSMSIPVLEGRTFNLNDNADAPPVAIVNQSMAKHCWPGQSAIGKRMHVGNPSKGLPWVTIVGVVADTKVGDQPRDDQWYFPALQPAVLYGAAVPETLTRPTTGYIVMRSALPPEHMTELLRSAVAEIDPLLALQQVRPMKDAIANVEAPRTFNTSLITAFAAGALLLAVTGIYTVMAFSVSQRAQEIAIRMAIGAQRTGIARLVLLAGAKVAALGCALGVLGSLAAARMVNSFLFEVSATDPFIYTGAVLLMLVMALFASTLPAMRAASANPMEALRSV